MTGTPGEYCRRPNGAKPSNHSRRIELWLEKEADRIWGTGGRKVQDSE